MQADSRFTVLAWLVIGASLGCNGGEATLDAGALCWPGGGTPSPGASVELGTGLNQFEPLITDSELILYRGPQGGAHFEVNARMQGLSPGSEQAMPGENPTTLFSAFRDDGEDISLFPCSYPLPYRDSSDGAYELPSGRVLQVQNMYIDALFGQRVRLTVEVRDRDGRYARDERWIVVGSEPEPVDAGAGDASTSGGDAAANEMHPAAKSARGDGPWEG